jgi:hypothetical protein
MPYRLNPVRAVKKLGYSKRDIIGPSDKCYSICAAYSSRDNAYNITPDCEKQCKDFVEKRRYEVYGVGRCDHQAPYRPVIWDNIPRYVPLLLKDGKSPEQVLEEAKKMCMKVPNLYNECVDMCNLDYDAIESYTEQRDDAITGVESVNSMEGSGLQGAKGLVQRTEAFNNDKHKENIKHHMNSNRSRVLLGMCLILLIMVIYLLIKNK